MLAAIAGLFGTGYFSKTNIRKGSLAIEFEKFGRVQDNDVITVNIRDYVNKNGMLGIWLNNSLQKHVLIKSISPKPVLETSADNKVIYYFKTDSDLKAFNLVIVIEPFKPGSINNEVGLLTGESISFKQFIYP